MATASVLVKLTVRMRLLGDRGQDQPATLSGGSKRSPSIAEPAGGHGYNPGMDGNELREFAKRLTIFAC